MSRVLFLFATLCISVFMFHVVNWPYVFNLCCFEINPSIYPQVNKTSQGMLGKWRFSTVVLNLLLNCARQKKKKNLYICTKNTCGAPLV